MSQGPVDLDQRDPIRRHGADRRLERDAAEEPRGGDGHAVESKLTGRASRAD